MCLYPRLVDNPKYKVNKKNKGVVPVARDPRVLMVPIGCGNCMECKRQRANSWRTRLLEHTRHNRNGKFVTFSFNDRYLVRLEEDLKQKGCSLEGTDLDDEIARLAVERFALRWKSKKGKRPHRWLCTELGQKNTERIHLHGVVWTDESKEFIEDMWKYGNVWIGDYCGEQTMNYIVKYMTKTDKLHKDYKGRVFASNGIGSGFINREDARLCKFKGKDTRTFYRLRDGRKVSMPIYYRNKLWSDEEREELWINLLDKEERYVNGIKLDMKKKNHEEEYYNVLKCERELNRKLGYGSNIINWERRFYERQRRNLVKKKRFAIYGNGNGDC